MSPGSASAVSADVRPVHSASVDQDLLFLDPARDVLGIEADEVTYLHEGHSPLGDETPDMSWGGREPFGQDVDVEEAVVRRQGSDWMPRDSTRIVGTDLIEFATHC